MEEANDSEVPNKYSTKKENAMWGSEIMIGVIGGMVYGGAKEVAASASKDAEIVLKMGSTPDKREQYRIMRDAMEKKFIRVARGSLIGGAMLGLFTCCFTGLKQILHEKRGVNDAFNIAGAGSATAALFGLLLPGSIRWRARNVLVGSVIGAGIGLPLGWIQTSLTEKVRERTKSTTNPEDTGETSPSGKPKQSRVADAIDRLEKAYSKD